VIKKLICFLRASSSIDSSSLKGVKITAKTPCQLSISLSFSLPIMISVASPCTGSASRGDGHQKNAVPFFRDYLQAGSMSSVDIEKMGLHEVICFRNNKRTQEGRKPLSEGSTDFA